MKGIIYKVTYDTGSSLEHAHGESTYTTNVVHIPTIHAEINHSVIREENENGDYTKKVNGVKPVKVDEISVSTEDVKIIKACLIARRQQTKVIEKYLGKQE